MAQAHGNGGFRRSLSTTLRLGTRSSRLALAQAEIVRKRLAIVGVDCRIIEISTIGDQDQTRAISEFATSSPFTDDIEAALRRGAIDIAVHSLKDMSLTPPVDLNVAAILERADPRESLVSQGDVSFDALPRGAVVGTSCARRAAQIRYLRPDLKTANIRGAVDDRIRQVRVGGFDAAILAIAGLDRSDLSKNAAEIFTLDRFVPAPAQAALAIQIRADDDATRRRIEPLDHGPTRDAVSAELALLAHFERRDDITIAAVAETADGVRMRVRVLRIEGRPLLEAVFAGSNGASVARRAIERVEETLIERKAAG
ncbi:MAG TPA: hydroxymethylbilane synthase [Phycisphaerae bacterium]|nr:hydroxymethylbilane synthase [Phycisphaerae bacterium]HRW54883.1 hydroxymethylbilane synthase [Phycisphaerae bacterium]